jgi:hypothetical protein
MVHSVQNKIIKRKKLRSFDKTSLRRKLSSQRGASITFGLLLFLVCAIITSVILVAGTTAAGRLSGMATNEQRYYSVVSSAEVVKDLLDNKSETVIKTGDDSIYVEKSSGEYEKVTETNSSSLLNSLSKYMAYHLCKGTSPIPVLVMDLDGLVTDANAKSVEIGIVPDNEKNTVNLKLSSDKYDVGLIISKNENKSNVNIGGDKAEKIVYTWKVSD